MRVLNIFYMRGSRLWIQGCIARVWSVRSGVSGGLRLRVAVSRGAGPAALAGRLRLLCCGHGQYCGLAGRGLYRCNRCRKQTSPTAGTILVRAEAGLDGVRIHDLRHSWASRALALGESLSMIGKLLGHTRIETTARYAHLERDTEKASAAKVGGSIGADILEMEGAEASPWPS